MDQKLKKEDLVQKIIFTLLEETKKIDEIEEMVSSEEIEIFLMKLCPVANLFLDYFINILEKKYFSQNRKIKKNSEVNLLLNYFRLFHVNVFVNIRQFFDDFEISELSQEITQKVLNELEDAKKVFLQSFHKFVNEGNLLKKDNLLKMTEFYLKLNFFVIIEGEEFSGKSYFLDKFINERKKNHSATDEGSKDPLKLVIDKSTEISNLIGNYVVTNNKEHDKQFEWKEGPFVTALKNGILFIVDNFELANDQLKSFLINCLVEKKCNYKNSKIDFHNQFRMIISTREKNLFENSIFKIKLDKNDIDKYLDSLCSSYQDKNFFRLIREISKILYELFHDYFQIKKFFERSEGIFSNILKNSDIEYLSSDLKTFIILNIIDIFYKGNRQSFLQSDILAKVQIILSSTSQEINILLSSYSTSLNCHPSFFKSNRFQISLQKSGNEQFVYTSQNLELIEKILGGLQNRENVLLVGETGTGKTTMVQEIARMYNKNLRVYNLSHSTDSVDLFGGFKPINEESYFRLIVNYLFAFMSKYFDLEKNKVFFDNIELLFKNKKYLTMAKHIHLACKNILNSYNSFLKNKTTNEKFSKIKSVDRVSEILQKTGSFIENPEMFANESKFEFVKGMVFKALENGDWVLFDEINLAGEEVLMRLNQLLTEDNIYILESNTLEIIQKPPDFRIFACMNPAYEIGKKPLPKRIEKTFTCFDFPPVDDFDEIYSIIEGLLKNFPIVSKHHIKNLSLFYTWLREESKKNEMLDKKEKKLILSLRQLRRALTIISNCFSNRRVSIAVNQAVYIGLRIAFYLDLNHHSKLKFNQKFEEMFETENIMQSYTEKGFFRLTSNLQENEILIENHPFVKANDYKDEKETNFIITPTLKIIFHDVLKILLFDSKIPILLEGPTSIGKTSLINFFASKLKKRIVRVNNHRDTDLDEYIGRFVPGKKGQIVFQKGYLLKSMEEGSWLLLDELNLAKSEILEALNRVFDDNQELYVPELEQVIKPHPNFRVFATQNPSNYSGRSLLSKAFKNRFVCINYEEINREDLSLILNQKCQLPQSRVDFMLDVKEKLMFLRSSQNYLNSESGLITIRDLIKWTERKDFFLDKVQLAYEGFALLGERIREESQKALVREILAKSAKLQTLDEIDYYNKIFSAMGSFKGLEMISWNDEFRKVFVLLNRGLAVKEPILLVGQTGCGKTTLAQIMAQVHQVPYYYINCHKNSEVSDFIGNWRPSRDKNIYKNQILACLRPKLQHTPLFAEISARKQLEVKPLRELITNNASLFSEEELIEIERLVKKLENEFEWVDGKLIKALKEGGVFLIDEISMASDNVLERFNSLLEFERKLFIQESEEGFDKEIEAHEKFFLIATMNPSGDHGKRELSPALRNRFTEIWVTSILDKSNFETDTGRNEIKSFLTDIILKKGFLQPEKLGEFCEFVFSFFRFFNKEGFDLFKPINLRDLDTLCNIVEQNKGSLGEEAVRIGSEMIFESCLGLVEEESLKKICDLKIESFKNRYPAIFKKQKSDCTILVDQEKKIFRINNISLEIKSTGLQSDYVLDEESIKRNLYRILIGMQSEKPILLEGPPGVGKTSLLQILAGITGQKLYKINIFAQTDMMDLLGADAPDPEQPGAFRWCDGILLRALKEGAWIIFDELNLANQTVLEGLNGILDFRGEVFVPELNRTVKKQKGFRFFGTQNPGSYGKGRKALPLSFLNRFFRLYLDEIPLASIRNIIYTVKNRLFPNLDCFEKFFDFLFEVMSQGLVESKLFNIRLMKSILKYINHFYNGANASILTTSCFYLFVILQNERKEKTPLLIKKFNECGFSSSFDIGFEECSQKELVLFDKKGEILKCKLTAGLLNFYEIFDNLKLLQLWSVSHAVEFNAPLILKTRSRTSEVLDCLQKLAVLNNRRVRKLFLYKSADDSDLLGSYDQFTWRFLFSEYLKKIRLRKKELFSKLKQNEENSDVILGLLREEEKVAEWEEREELKKLISYTVSKKPFFNWVDSELAKAVKNGDWVVLVGCENANPALLEKLNGVLEDDYLVINECFEKTEEVRKIEKHKNFRIFLFFDNNKKCKISDPLKNRCISIDFDEISDVIHFNDFSQTNFCFLRNLNFISNQIVMESSISLNFLRNFQDTRNFKFLENFISCFVNPFFTFSEISQNFIPKPKMDLVQEKRNDLLFETVEKLIIKKKGDEILEVLNNFDFSLIADFFDGKYKKEKDISQRHFGELTFFNELDKNQDSIEIEQKDESFQNKLLCLKLIEILKMRIFNPISPQKKVKLKKKTSLFELLLKNDISQKLNFLKDQEIVTKKILLSMEILEKELNLVILKKREKTQGLFEIIKFENEIFEKTEKICCENIFEINEKFDKLFIESKQLFMEIQDPITFEKEIYFFYDKTDLNLIYSLITNIDILNSEKEEKLNFLLQDKFKNIFLFLQKFNNFQKLKSLLNSKKGCGDEKTKKNFDFYIFHTINSEMEKNFNFADFTEIEPNLLEIELIQKYLNDNLSFIVENIPEEKEEFTERDLSVIKSELSSILREKNENVIENDFFHILADIFKNEFVILKSNLDNIDYGYKLLGNCEKIKKEKDSLKKNIIRVERLYRQLSIKSLMMDNEVDDLPNNFVSSEIFEKTVDKLKSSRGSFDNIILNDLINLLQNLHHPNAKEEIVRLFFSIFQNYEIIFYNREINEIFERLRKIVGHFYRKKENTTIFGVIDNFKNLQINCIKEKLRLNFFVKNIIDNKELILNLQKEVTADFEREFKELIAKLKDSQRFEDKRSFTEAGKLIVLEENLNKLARYEYNKISVEKNREEKKLEIENTFKNYKEDFEVREDDFASNELTKVSKLESDFHNRSKEFYFNLITELLIKENLEFSIKKDYLDFIFILKKNLKDFGLEVNVMKNLLKKRIGRVLIEKESSFSLSNIVIDSTKETDPLQKTIESEIKKKIEYSKTFSFYQKNENIEVMKEAVGVVKGLMKKLQGFLRERDFLEIKSLVILTQLCQKVIELDIKSPLSKLATGLNLVASNLLEFNSILPKNLKLVEEYDQILKHLVSLRKLEKQMWKKMLVLREHEIKNQEILNFVSLKSSLTKSPEDLTVFAFVEDQLSNSTIGTFTQKIFLFYTIGDTFKTEDMRKIYLNILRFYAAKVYYLEEKKEELLKDVDEPMKNVAKLMNWHFEDLVNLKMNLEKLYRGINKSLKKQKEILDLNFNDVVIQAQRNQILFHDILSFFKNAIQILEITQKEEKVVSKNKLETLFKNESFVHLASFRIISLKELLIVSESDFNPAKFGERFSKEVQFGKQLEQLLQNYLERIESVKDQKLNFKLRTLNDFLKDINIFNVSQRINIANLFTYRNMFERLNIIEYEKKIEKVLPRNLLGSKEFIDKINKNNLRIFLTLECIKKIKEDIKYHENIPQKGHEKMIASLYSFYFKFLDHIELFDEIYKKAAVICETLDHFNENSRKIEKIKFFVNYFLQSDELGEKSGEDAKKLRKIKSLVDSDQIPSVLPVFQNPELSNLNLLITQIKEDSESREIAGSSEFSETYIKLAKRFKKHLLEIERSESGDCIILELKLMSSIARFLSDLLKVKGLGDLSKTEKELVLVDVRSKVLHCLNWISSLNKFLYVMAISFSNLLYKGFCVSKEEMGEQKEGDEEEMDFGTGVGEGTGDQNVAEEIEYEEQVLGEKDDEREEEEQQPNGEEENQMEMENDFEGKNTDENEKEKNEQNQKDENEINDEFDDVDEEDLDPKLFKEEDSEEEEEEERDINKTDKMQLERQNSQEENNLKAEDQKEEKRKLDEKEELLKNEEEEPEDRRESDKNEESEEMEFEEDNQKDFREEEDVKQNDPDEEGESEEDLDISDREAQSQSLEEDENNFMEEEEIGSEIDLEEKQENEDLENLEEKENEVYELEEMDQNNTGEENQNNNTSKNQMDNENKGEEKDENEKKEYLHEENNDEGLKESLEKKMKELFENENDSKELHDVNIDFNENSEKEEEERQEDNINNDYEIDKKKGGLKARANLKSRKNEEDKKEEEKSKEETRKERKEKNRKKGEEEPQEEEEDNLLKKRSFKEEESEMDDNRKKEKLVEESNEDLMRILEEYGNDKLRALVTENDIFEIANEMQILINREANKLCENLKSILEQKKYTSLKGDYRTGKKINMKKIVSYIASNYRKDKIWLRRSLPDEKDYRIMIAIDNSLSMKEKEVGKLALFSLNVLGLSIFKAQVGDVCVSKISNGFELVAENSDWTLRERDEIFRQFDFGYEDDFSSDLAMSNFVQNTRAFFRSKNDDKKNICFIISDGRMNKENVKKVIIGSEEEDCLFFMVILDSENLEHSIINYKTTEIVEKNGVYDVLLKNYMDDFPFEHFIIIRDINNLSEVIIKILMEYFDKFN